jgi:hypothetical protein
MRRKKTYHHSRPAIQMLMAEGEMHTLVVDKTVGAQAIWHLLGTLPVLLKDSNIGRFLDISGKGGRIAAFFLLELLHVVNNC